MKLLGVVEAGVVVVVVVQFNSDLLMCQLHNKMANYKASTKETQHN
jgi:hypothetical protein